MAKIKGQTNYEINQAGYRQLPTPSEEEVNNFIKSVGCWLSFQNQIKYLGVLCRERNDYTIIHLKNFNYEKAAQELRDLLNSRGEILDIRYVHGHGYYEGWVRERIPENLTDFLAEKWEPQVYMFVIFNANDWVIEVE